MASKSDYWYNLGKDSVLLNAVSKWRTDSEEWFQGSFERLPETVRVNPLREDSKWVEDWLIKIGSKRISWFNGVGSAWTLPFERGKIDGENRVLLSSLHETGRLTRQESVSMIPAIALDTKPGEIILDMCASPGSKTTQISEHLNNKGLVVANEIASSRINTLVSNSQRHGSRTCMIVNHDGRHIPKIPGLGYDRVLVDAPCTGSGTTRKNPDVWRKWLPSGGRSLHKLQIDLLSKGIEITKPGGRIVYSTCSLDPVENEAVVAEMMRRYAVKIVQPSTILSKLLFDEGLTKWPILDDKGDITTELDVVSSTLPPTESNILESIRNCVRIWNDKNNGGGFFVAILEKMNELNIKIPKKILNDNQFTEDSIDLPQPIGSEITDKIMDRFGSCPDNLWIRGKKILWCTKEAKYIWENEKSRKSGRIIIPGKRWKPLKVIHLGLDTIKLRNKEMDRIIGRAAQQIISEIDSGFIEVSRVIINRLLIEEEIFPLEIDADIGEFKGSLVLVDETDGACLPVWIGSRVSLMVNEPERIIMRAIRGLKVIINEEE